ncbi:hypothetical protein K503DRAFT_395844 [Rhizopogon vinicolor AM-OR11-026]|uniref:Uncharacterized protein n=1 Tax=Rhizopogon vinicolor AM-OR11-026 TaxID=1314800 RepID=A0A1B7NBH7_9AGAM|nr:hypothetical protein K503DRAFT_395844 [Rhizopogon vinicolor AM-OR11-026]
MSLCTRLHLLSSYQYEAGSMPQCLATGTLKAADLMSCTVGRPDNKLDGKHGYILRVDPARKQLAFLIFMSESLLCMWSIYSLDLVQLYAESARMSSPSASAIDFILGFQVAIENIPLTSLRQWMRSTLQVAQGPLTGTGMICSTLISGLKYPYCS